MQSFGQPRPTSNPYIHMLDEALDADPKLDHRRFDRRHALVGRYDAIHFHWPETLLGGSTPAKRLARRMYATALLARLFFARTTIVRTAHNLDLPSGLSRWDRWFLENIDRRTDFYIRLNEETPTRPGVPSTVIPHGHYRDWFASVSKLPADSESIGFVGLVRRYKGVETLIEAFRSTRGSLPSWRLRISGNPSPGLAPEVQALAAPDERISLELGYLSEEHFAQAIMRSGGIVLPYRAMHNSGTALAALSLDRAVLVPRNTVNEALSEEVGAGWVHMFDETLSAADLTRFAEELERNAPVGTPHLDGRGWAVTGARHRQAFEEAVAMRRRTRR